MLRHAMIAVLLLSPLAHGDGGTTPTSTPGRNTAAETVDAPAMPAPQTMQNARRRAPEAPAGDDAVAALPDGQAVIDRFVEAVGGRAALDGVPGVRTTGSIAGPMGTIAATSAADASGRFALTRAHHEHGALSVGFDGSIGWLGSDSGAARLLDAAEVRSHGASCDPVAIVRAFPRRYGSFRTTGRAAFDGADCLEVSMIDELGSAATAWFDAETALLVAVRVGDPDAPALVRFADWRDTGGLRLFRTMHIDQGDVRQSVRWSSIELAAVDASAFERPDSVRQLAGEGAGPVVRTRSTNASAGDSDTGR